jgi:hypothetical protein
MKQKAIKMLLVMLLLLICVFTMTGSANLYQDVDAFVQRCLSEADVNDGNDEFHKGLRDYFLKDGVCDSQLITVVQKQISLANDKRTNLQLASYLVDIDWEVGYSYANSSNTTLFFEFDYSLSTDTALQTLITADWDTDGWFKGDNRDLFIQVKLLYAAINNNPARARQVVDSLMAADMTDEQRRSVLNCFNAYCSYADTDNVDVAWELLPDMLAGGWPSAEEANEMEDSWLPLIIRLKLYTLEGTFAVLRFLASEEMMNEDVVSAIGDILSSNVEIPVDNNLVLHFQNNEETGIKPVGPVVILRGESDVYHYLNLDMALMMRLPMELLPTSLSDAAIIIYQNPKYTLSGHYTNGAKAYDCTVTAYAYDANTNVLLHRIASYMAYAPTYIYSSAVEGRGTPRYNMLQDEILEWLVDGE